MFKDGRLIDQLRLAGNTFYRQSGYKTVARCKLCNLYNITYDFFLFQSVVLLLQVLLKSTFTFYSSTFYKLLLLLLN